MLGMEGSKAVEVGGLATLLSPTVCIFQLAEPAGEGTARLVGGLRRWTEA